MSCEFKIIDAHSHLWLRQDTEWNGMAIKQMENGRSMFLGEEVQMLPPFMIDGRNSAEVFLSNMNYAQVSAAVVVQELIDGNQNNYLEQVRATYPTRFQVCGMVNCFGNDMAEEVKKLADRGFQGIAVPGHRLILNHQRVLLNSPEMMKMYRVMTERGLFLSVTLADGDLQTGELREVIETYPELRIAIGHFGMPTREKWTEQVKLARYKNVMVESGGITWLYNSEFYPFLGAIRAIREAADLVGMDKLMWGSDYPRTITAITYRMSYDFVVKNQELSEEDKKLFLGENARRFYGFEELIELPYIKNMSE
ncbi:MAG: amidohydrolase [Prevotella sp.]|nr:amidohydrolase [Prevotella sp.]